MSCHRYIAGFAIDVAVVIVYLNISYVNSLSISSIDVYHRCIDLGRELFVSCGEA